MKKILFTVGLLLILNGCYSANLHIVCDGYCEADVERGVEP